MHEAAVRPRDPGAHGGVFVWLLGPRGGRIRMSLLDVTTP
jgi:hypothetical protein